MKMVQPVQFSRYTEVQQGPRYMVQLLVLAIRTLPSNDGLERTMIHSIETKQSTYAVTVQPLLSFKNS